MNQRRIAISAGAAIGLLIPAAPVTFAADIPTSQRIAGVRLGLRGSVPGRVYPVPLHRWQLAHWSPGHCYGNRGQRPDTDKRQDNLPHPLVRRIRKLVRRLHLQLFHHIRGITPARSGDSAYTLRFEPRVVRPTLPGMKFLGRFTLLLFHCPLSHLTVASSNGRTDRRRHVGNQDKWL